jgi:Flp pilus assembly pilin Flp
MLKPKFHQHERGQGLAEYALALVLISYVTFAVLMTMGTGLGRVFTKINNSLIVAAGGEASEDGEGGESSTPGSTPVSTPTPISTPTPGPSPTATSTPLPSLTPSPTSTQVPTLTPTSSPSPTPVPLVYDPLIINYTCPKEGMVSALDTTDGYSYGTHSCTPYAISSYSFFNSEAYTGHTVVIKNVKNRTIASGVFPAGHP